MNINTKKICLIGICIALAVAVGYAFLLIPNIEIITATIFIAGYLLGLRNGIFIGITAEAIFSFTNPYGIPSPPLFVAQIISMGFTGFLGALFSSPEISNHIKTHLKFACAGLIATVFFAVCTNVAFIVSMGFHLDKFFSTILTGLHFYVIHIVSNMIIFFTIVPLLINKLQKNKLFKQITD
ncbi:MAG: ECF transporter S component [bacterium]